MAMGIKIVQLKAGRRLWPGKVRGHPGGKHSIVEMGVSQPFAAHHAWHLVYFVNFFQGAGVSSFI